MDGMCVGRAVKKDMKCVVCQKKKIKDTNFTCSMKCAGKLAFSQRKVNKNNRWLYVYS